MKLPEDGVIASEARDLVELRPQVPKPR